MLGPLEVVDGVRSLNITAPKQRAVLCVLLASANQVVSLDQMIEHLWGDQPPPQATAALHMYISNLRRAFEPHRAPRSSGQVLLSRPPGYVLVVDDDLFDASRFTSGVSNAQARLAGGRPGQARQLLDRALGLWRGPAYAEFDQDGFARAEIARLELLRVIALEARAEADLALGQSGAAASELEDLVARYPFRENLWAAYLLALYRSGRQADALRAYQSCRAQLVEELGIGPGPELRRLEAAILAQDPSLDWCPGAAGTLPIALPAPSPGDGASTGAMALVGRSAELRRLKELYREADAGRGACVLVSGEAGIGKTRLVEELAAGAATAGADVVWGRCYEGADAPAFWPWSQILRDLLAGCPPEAATEALRRSGLDPGDLTALGSRPTEATSAEPPPIADSGAARLRLNQAVTVVVTALSERPVVVILDDIHWADVATLRLLAYLAPELAAARVLLIATYRDREVADDHPLVEALASIARRSRVERIPLWGLTQDEVARFVTVASGGETTPSVVESVYRRTDGNPFFVGELVRLLMTDNALDDPVAAAGADVPVGVRDVVRRRLARLPEETKALLSIAAVVGQEFDLQVVEAVGGLQGDAVLDALEPARLSGVIVESPGSVRLCRFSHALLHETLYGGMSKLRRARLHGRVADALESQAPANAVEQARHLWQATPVVGTERVLAALLKAAEESMAGLAYEQAGEQLARAVQLLSTQPPGEDRDRLELWAQVRLGMARATIKGNPDPGVTAAFARARELCTRVTHPPEQLPTLYGLFLVSWVQLDLATAATFAAQLLEVARSTLDPTFVVAGHQALGLTAFEHGELAAARHHFQQAVLTADSLADPWLAEVLQGDPSITGRCFGAFVEALWGRPSEAGALAAEGLERARRSRHPWTIAVALNMRTWVEVVLRDADRAEAYADEAAAYIAEQRFELLAAATSSMRAWAKAARGDTASGLALVESGLLGREATGMRLMLSFNLALSAEIEQQAGLIERALATVDQGLAEVEQTDERFYEAELHRLRGELLMALAPDAAPEAEACFRRAVEVAARQGARLLEQRAQESLDRLLERMPAAR